MRMAVKAALRLLEGQFAGVGCSEGGVERDVSDVAAGNGESRQLQKSAKLSLYRRQDGLA